MKNCLKILIFITIILSLLTNFSCSGKKTIKEKNIQKVSIDIPTLYKVIEAYSELKQAIEDENPQDYIVQNILMRHKITLRSNEASIYYNAIKEISQAIVDDDSKVLRVVTKKYGAEAVSLIKKNLYKIL